MRGATAGPLFLYCPSMPVTRAKFNEQLRGALQFCHFCPKQSKSHSFRIAAATTAAAQGMSDSQIRSLGIWFSDAFMKYLRCSQRMSALLTIMEYLHDYLAKKHTCWDVLLLPFSICFGFENIFLPPSVCMLQVSRVLRPEPSFTRTNRAGATIGTTSSPSCLGLLVSGIHVLGCSSAI